MRFPRQSAKKGSSTFVKGSRRERPGVEWIGLASQEEEAIGPARLGRDESGMEWQEKENGPLDFSRRPF